MYTLVWDCDVGYVKRICVRLLLPARLDCKHHFCSIMLTYLLQLPKMSISTATT